MLEKIVHVELELEECCDQLYYTFNENFLYVRKK